MEVYLFLFLEKIKKDNTNTLLKTKEEESEEIDNHRDRDKVVEEVEEEEDKDQDKKTPLNKLQNNKHKQLQPHERRMFFIQIILKYFIKCLFIEGQFMIFGYVKKIL